MQILFFVVAGAEEDFPLVHCETTKGPLTIEVHKSWSPLGAERFLELVKDEFFTDIAFFRCVEGFLTQFGYGVVIYVYGQSHSNDLKYAL